MSKPLSRRDFLKLAGLASGNVALPSVLRTLPPAQPAQPGKKNILIVVFDTFSAFHLAIYGYARETAPNITRLAERAIVYHNHFAAGPWTVPSTASLLTGVLPWTHRALSIDQPVIDSLVGKNIFHAFNDYYRIAYSHNGLVYTYFDQFETNLDKQVPIERLFLNFDYLSQTIFRNDDALFRLGWRRIIKRGWNGGYAYSLLLSEIYKDRLAGRIRDLEGSFPRGLPNIESDNYFVLEQGINFLGAQVQEIPRPFLAYFHFLPPHDPYRTRREFFDYFINDQFQPLKKPRDIFAGDIKLTRYKQLVEFRRRYDEFVLYVDAEFGRLFQQLEDSGVLQDTWVILTSDHGELFERGVVGHGQPVVYQPVMRIPLMIFEPGRADRLDIDAPTSTIDLLPSLLHIAGSPPATWSEGRVLPPFAGEATDANRSIYGMNARFSDPKAPLTIATVMLVKGRYKLTYFFGYEQLKGRERIELYDIRADPEELNNLYSAERELGREMLDELKSRMLEADQPYR